MSLIHLQCFRNPLHDHVGFHICSHNILPMRSWIIRNMGVIIQSLVVRWFTKGHMWRISAPISGWDRPLIPPNSPLFFWLLRPLRTSLTFCGSNGQSTFPPTTQSPKIQPTSNKVLIVAGPTRACLDQKGSYCFQSCCRGFPPKPHPSSRELSSRALCTFCPLRRTATADAVSFASETAMEKSITENQELFKRSGMHGTSGMCPAKA